MAFRHPASTHGSRRVRMTVVPWVELHPESLAELEAVPIVGGCFVWHRPATAGGLLLKLPLAGRFPDRHVVRLRGRWMHHVTHVFFMIPSGGTLKLHVRFHTLQEVRQLQQHADLSPQSMTRT